jgi:hypothetical protein
MLHHCHGKKTRKQKEAFILLVSARMKQACLYKATPESLHWGRLAALQALFRAPLAWARV